MKAKIRLDIRVFVSVFPLPRQQAFRHLTAMLSGWSRLLFSDEEAKGSVTLSHLPKVAQGSRDASPGAEDFRPELPRFRQQEGARAVVTRARQ